MYRWLLLKDNILNLVSTVSVTEGGKETTTNKKARTPTSTIDDNILTTDKSTTSRKVATASKTKSTPIEQVFSSSIQ